ncbi:hypothetical protein FB451DRAFT_1177095 [Mycena latifolia]|nr:hypothetical protein FB451DRAFT_1177095 [Mycena latifolia]
MLALAQHALHLAPTAAKAVAVLFLFCARSWPLVWHLRVFSSVISAHVAFRLREGAGGALEAWHEARMSVGVHPFRKVWNYASRAKMAVDAARFRLALATFPNIFRCIGWVLLAGGSGSSRTSNALPLLREIPMLLRSEVRASIGEWDDKWIWVISRFVKPAAASASSNNSKSPAENAETPANPLVATLKTPVTPLLETPASSTPFTPGAHTPFAATPNGGTNGDGVQPDADEVAKVLLARGAKQLEPNGRCWMGKGGDSALEFAALFAVLAHRSWSCALCFMHYALRVSACAMVIQHTVRGSPARSWGCRALLFLHPRRGATRSTVRRSPFSLRGAGAQAFVPAAELRAVRGPCASPPSAYIMRSQRLRFAELRAVRVPTYAMIVLARPSRLRARSCALCRRCARILGLLAPWFVVPVRAELYLTRFPPRVSVPSCPPQQTFYAIQQAALHDFHPGVLILV